jgi:hypothetical protein
MNIALVVALVLPILIPGSILLASAYLRWKSRASRIALLNSLPSASDDQLVSQRRIIVGFFHPYWYGV